MRPWAVSMMHVRPCKPIDCCKLESLRPSHHVAEVRDPALAHQPRVKQAGNAGQASLHVAMAEQVCQARLQQLLPQHQLLSCSHALGVGCRVYGVGFGVWGVGQLWALGFEMGQAAVNLCHPLLLVMPDTLSHMHQGLQCMHGA